MHNINFFHIVKDYLSELFEKPKHLNFLKAFVKPLSSTNQNFINFKNDIIYKISFTGQVIYLERLLNNKFDPVNRAIFIRDGNTLDRIYLRQIVEKRPPLYLRRKSESKPIYLRRKSEYDALYDFIVCIPTTISLTNALKAQMSAEIDFYRQAGMTYQIKHC
jgi:hypothetical protein